MTLELLGLPPTSLAWMALATLVAFIVRGLSGFGSSMIGIGSLSMVLPPAQVIPVFLFIEVVTSINLVPSTWRQVHWASLRWVALGTVVATPLGLMLLAKLDANPMRLVVSGCLMVIALFMLAGLAQRLAPRGAPRSGSAVLVGLIGGLLTGAAGIGGPPAIVYYFATVSVAVGRATLITYLLMCDVYALAWMGGSGLLGGTAWALVLVALPFSFIGSWIGQRWYARLNDAQLRRVIWALLVALGAAGVLSAAWRMA